MDTLIYDSSSGTFYDQSGNVIDYGTALASGAMIVQMGTGLEIDPATLAPVASTPVAATPTVTPTAAPVVTAASSSAVNEVWYNPSTKSFQDQIGNAVSQSQASSYAAASIPFYNSSTGQQLNPYTLQPLQGGPVSSATKPTATGPVSSAVSVPTTPVSTPSASQTLSSYAPLLAIAGVGLIAVMMMSSGKKRK